MIRRLTLQSWKAYDDISIEFHAGTTFLIAENGIGKTSVVQAIYFALFGGPSLFGSDGDPVEVAVRGGDNAKAIVECEFVFDGKVVAIRREISRSKTSEAAVAVVKIDGHDTSELELFELLKSSTRLDRSQLASLAFMKEGSIYRDDNAGSIMVSAVKATFGTDQLDNSASRLSKHAIQIAKDADNLRKSLRDSPAKEGVRERGELTIRVNQISELRDSLAGRLASLNDDFAHWELWRSFQTELLNYQRNLHEMVVGLRESECLQLTNDLWEQINDFNTIRELCSNAKVRTEAELEQLVQTRGRVEAQMQNATQALVELDSGQGVCPTCLRPLSDSERIQAHDRHSVSLESVRAELEVTELELTARRNAIRTLERFISNSNVTLPVPPSGAEADSAPDTETRDRTQFELDQLDAEAKSSVARIAAIDALANEAAKNNELSLRLTRMYRESLLAEVTADSLRSLAHSIVEERIDPIMRETEKRWAEFWSGEQLSSSENGLSISFADVPVPYSQFSGGQRTVAQIIARLLAIQMTSTCPFLVFDEPLEHLDPRNRRQLVSLLAAAPQGESHLRQIIVTTYEESVARRLESHQLKAESESPISVVRVAAMSN